jgi:hypothetical protein
MIKGCYLHGFETEFFIEFYRPILPVGAELLASQTASGLPYAGGGRFPPPGNSGPPTRIFDPRVTGNHALPVA